MRNVLAYHAILFLSLNWSVSAIASVDSNIETNKSLSCEETVDFAYKLSLINGHLWAASELVAMDQFELASRHSKHPSEEIYVELQPYFDATESRGFSEELTRLSNLFETNNVANFPAAYAATSQRINRHLEELPLSDDGKRVIVFQLLSQALVEFEVGVEDGKVADLQEYQDARGFTEIAGNIAGGLGPIERGINRAKTLWPNLVPSDTEEIEEAVILRRLTDRMSTFLSDGSRQNLCVGLN